MKHKGGEKTVYNALVQSKSFFGLCAALSTVERDWESIAGKSLAVRSVPRAFDDGVLVVAVKNRLAQQDMNFKKTAILKVIFDKTSLKLKDIRTEIGWAPRYGDVPEKTATPSRKRKDAPVKYGPDLELIKTEIMSQNPGLGIELAAIIAQCRLDRMMGR
ncbi:MAG: DUF721 domain-containing protein [Synergistaceae bacterium]|nr:DUF721 domain-containing protein [Synergistaceae bacterium]